MNEIVNLPIIPGIVLYTSCIVILGLLLYLCSHFFYIRSRLNKKHERVGRVLFKSSAGLMALLLSFNFALQQDDHNKVKSSLELQAAKLVNLHIDLRLYNSPEAAIIQKNLREYIDIVLEEGWDPITENPLLSKTYILFNEIYEDIFNLKPTDDFQSELKNKMLSNVQTGIESVQIRIYQSKPEIPFLIYVAILGFAITAILFSVYEPDKISIPFFSIYSIFIGVVMYFIMLLNNPFSGPMQIISEPFQILQEAIEIKY